MGSKAGGKNTLTSFAKHIDAIILFSSFFVIYFLLFLFTSLLYTFFFHFYCCFSVFHNLAKRTLLFTMTPSLWSRRNQTRSRDDKKGPFMVTTVFWGLLHEKYNNENQNFIGNHLNP